MTGERVYVYDCTLRDGAQTYGVDFSATDKAAIARDLDALGVDYVEGGWPGANPTDDAFFANRPALGRARYSAFGMTRRSGRSADNDPGLRPLLDAGVDVLTIVGKAWDYQAEVALGVDLDENLRMIGDSIAFLDGKVDEVLYDAEHFFDGWKANPDYAMAALQAAADGGARWLVLCDTNGGTLPDEIGRITETVCVRFGGERVGIHCHDDTGTAVAGSLAAVRAGARQVQGCLNGLGERCGNANLVSIIPSLALKMGFDTGVSSEQMARLREVSHRFDERLNRAPSRNAPYVGDSAFAHKGGLHVSAVSRDPKTYEHVPPESVGNRRRILISDQAGRSNFLARFREIGVEVDANDPKVARLIHEVKQLESNGYAFDGAEASFELLARRMLDQVPDYYRVNTFRVIDERQWKETAHGLALDTRSEAIVKVTVAGATHMTVAEGNGPVNALDAALRKVLVPIYPQLERLRLVDYKVRILTPDAATAAVTRVLIDSDDGAGNTWTTVGVSTNIIDASYNALRDSIAFMLWRSGVRA